MTTAEMIRKLQAEGVENAKGWIIGHGIAAGYLKRPTLTSSLQFDWKPREVEAVRKYLANVPKPGRRKAKAGAA